MDYTDVYTGLEFQQFSLIFCRQCILKPVSSSSIVAKPGHFELPRAYGKAVKPLRSYGQLMQQTFFLRCAGRRMNIGFIIATHYMPMMVACMRL
jgi:hypothetical protein